MRLGIPIVLGIPVAALFAGLVGLLIAIPATRLRTVYLALATYAFAEFAQWVFRTWESVTKGPDGLRLAAPDIFGYVVGQFVDRGVPRRSCGRVLRQECGFYSQCVVVPGVGGIYCRNAFRGTSC